MTPFLNLIISYVKVMRNIHVGSSPGTRYLAKIFRGETIETRQLCDRITTETSLSRGDVLSCLTTLTDVCAEYLASGHSVRIGDLGILSPAIHATAKTTLAQVDASTIKSAYILFRPSKDMKQMLKMATFKEKNLDITGLQSYNVELQKGETLITKEKAAEIEAAENELKAAEKDIESAETNIKKAAKK
ncbi:MAG: HU family DNA-binding protein [Bacteroidales bacterium]|jgi:predicted histone-like DNA-binding protein|nr:HU family DNA-binding protein [Bacteroidales bacterium]